MTYINSNQDDDTNLEITYREFNFAEYKRLLCTAYQTASFDQAFILGKADYSETFYNTLPYPIKDYPVEYELFCRHLEKQIISRDLVAMELISKSQAKTDYKLNDLFFTMFYHIPEEIAQMQNSKERFGKARSYSHLYNRNKIISILESSEYQEHLQSKKTKKNNPINYF